MGISHEEDMARWVRKTITMTRKREIIAECRFLQGALTRDHWTQASRDQAKHRLADLIAELLGL